MKFTVHLPEPVLRFIDDARGEYPMEYLLTVSADVKEDPEQYHLTSHEVEATDLDGEVEVWPWRHLSSREQDEAEEALIEAFKEAQEALRASIQRKARGAA